MQRREFLAAAGGGAALLAHSTLLGQNHAAHQASGRIYTSPAEAMASPREELAYVVATYAGTKVQQPDFLATVDLDPASRDLWQGRPSAADAAASGDELHHFGWNACGSCHGEKRAAVSDRAGAGQQPHSHRRHGRSQAAEDAQGDRAARDHREDEADRAAHGALPDRRADHDLDARQRRAGDGPGGFLLLDEEFNIAGRWEASREGMHYNYDFWYQPRQNVMVSSEWAAPSTTRPGFKLEDVKAGQVRPARALLGLGVAEDRADGRPGREGADPAGSPLPPQPGQHARLRRRGAVERDVALAQGGRQVAGRSGDRSASRARSPAGRSRCRG